MKKKILIVLVVLLFLVGCAQRSQNGTNGSDANDMVDPGRPNDIPTDSDSDGKGGDGEEAPSEPTFNEGQIDKSTDTKKIITNIYYGLESKNFDEDLEKINTSARALGGAIKSLQVSGSKADERYASTRTVQAVYQIPYDNLDEFNKNFEGLSMVNQSMTSEDVSKDYRDNKLRIQSLETQYNRILELIASAESIDAIIVLESRLSQLELEINYLKGANLEIEDRSDNVTITISIKEIAESGRLTTDTSFGSKISEAFTNMLTNTGNFFVGLAVGIVSYLPIVVIVLVLAFIGLDTYKKMLKKEVTKSVPPKDDENLPE